MNRNLISVLLVLMLLFTACSARQSAMDVNMEEAGYYYAEAPAAARDREDSVVAPAEPGAWGNTNDGAGSSADDLPRMIVYNGEITLVVKDTTQSQDDITTLITALGGYINASSSSAYGSGLLRITLTVRVPAEKFHAAMESLREMALNVTAERIYSEDVTQEYVDLESRLGALEAKAERLEELMAQAEDTEAVLAVYRELSQTQMEIEQTKGRMRYLERTAAMATITISLVPDEGVRPVEVAGWRPQGTVLRAIESLIKTFQWLIDVFLWVILWIVPVLGFIGLVIYGFIRVLRWLFFRRKSKNSGEPTPPSTK